MLSASNEFIEKIENGNPIFTRADITLADGTELTMTASDFAFSGGYRLNTATSNSNTFDIGACITGELDLKLINYDGHLDNYTFDKAKVIGYVYSEELKETIQQGIFYVDTQDFNSGMVTLTCYDVMVKFDTDFTLARDTEQTASQWVSDLANLHNIALKNARFNNSTLMLSVPSEGQYTEAQVLNYILMCTGNYAKIDEKGQLCVAWYDTAKIVDIIDGGKFTSPSADIIDAGDVSEMDSVATIYSGGDFTDRADGEVVINHIFSHTIAIDDVEVTGVRITLNDGTTALSGSEGYVLSISNNPLVTSDNIADITARLWSVCKGLRFRPMTLSILSNPLIQTGDILLVEVKGNYYYTIATVVDYQQGNHTSITCGAESPTKNASKFGTQQINIDKQVNKIVDTRLTAYDKAVLNLSNLMSQSLGLYTTEVVLDDGSTVFYMHDKPTIAESKNIFKLGAEGLAVSNNGGSTYNSGWDSSGNLVMNMLSVVGIKFDWATGGTLTLGGSGNGNGVCNVKNSSGTTLVTLDNKGITLSNGMKISYNSLSDTPSIPTTSDITNITNNAISTAVINASKINGGTLTLGGSGNGNGTMEVKNSSGTTTVKCNNAGITATAGKIAGFDVSESGFTSYTSTLISRYLKSQTSYGSSGSQLYDSSGAARIQTANGTLVWGYGWNETQEVYRSRICPTVIADLGQSWQTSSWHDCYLDGGVFGRIGRFSQDIQVAGDTVESLEAMKNAAIKTRDYGTRLLRCYETATPMFGDAGTARLDETGTCYVYIPDEFLQVINTKAEYLVFLQPYGKGECYVDTIDEAYFIIKGEPNLRFAWELKCNQCVNNSSWLTEDDGSLPEPTYVGALDELLEESTQETNDNETNVLTYEANLLDENEALNNYLLNEDDIINQLLQEVE